MAPRPEHPDEIPNTMRTPVRTVDGVAILEHFDQQLGTMKAIEDQDQYSARDDVRSSKLNLSLTRSVSKRAVRSTRTGRVPAPDGGWGWMVLLGVVIGNILLMGHAKTFGVYLPALIEHFNAKPSAVAWIQSIQFSFFLLFAPLASMLAEKYTPRTVTLVASMIACLGMVLSALSSSLEHLYLSYGIMMGLASVFTFTPGIMMISKYFDRRRGLANGLGMAGNSLGGIFMPILAEHLMSEYSIHGGFLIMSGILLNAAVGAMLWRPLTSNSGQTYQRRSLSTTKQTVTDVDTTNTVPSLSAHLHDHKLGVCGTVPPMPASLDDNPSVPSVARSPKAFSRPLIPASEKVEEHGQQSEVPPMPGSRSMLEDDPFLTLDHLSTKAASAPVGITSTNCSASVPDVSVGISGQTLDQGDMDSCEVHSQPSKSPPPVALEEVRERKKEEKLWIEQNTKRDRTLTTSTQRSFDHESIFSHSTASLSSFVYLSTFHLGPSFGTVEDITNLKYDQDGTDNGVDLDDREDYNDGREAELDNLRESGDCDDDDDEEEDDYDVYETVRARSDLKVDIIGLLANAKEEQESTFVADLLPKVKGLEEVLLPKKATTHEVTSGMGESNSNSALVAGTRNDVKHKNTDHNLQSSMSIRQKRALTAKTRKPPKPNLNNKYLDFSFFRLAVFYVMMVPLFLHSIGYPTIQMYTPMFARRLGFSTSDSARCLSFLAFADVAGRIGCAWLSDLHICKRKYFYMTGMFFSGIMAYLLSQAETYMQLLLCTSGFGLASGAYIGLTVALFADAFGNEKVVKAHSMATMCTGVAGLAGGPLIGFILEKTDSFVLCYTILGSCQILGSLVYFLEPWAARKDAIRNRAQQWV